MPRLNPPEIARQARPPASTAVEKARAPVSDLSPDEDAALLEFLPPGALTFKERLFVDYLTGTITTTKDGRTVRWNKSASARAAGYPEETAGAIGCQLADKHRALIEERLREQLVLARITAQKVLRHWAAIAFQDPRDYYREDGSLKPLSELTEDQAVAVSGLETDELWAGRGEDREQIGTTKKLKFWDKQKALDVLASALGLAGQDVAGFFQGLFRKEEPDGTVTEVAVRIDDMPASELARLYNEMVKGGPA